MTRRRTLARMLVLGTLIAGGLVATTQPAAADFHLMKVEEVFAGTVSDATADFVELEMQDVGQGNVSGHPLQLFDATGARFDCALPVDVPNQASGDEILFATTTAESAHFVDADFVIPPMLDGTSGAACFAGVDCVSWGSFGGSTPSPAGTPFVGGIPPDQSIDRGPDTNNSATDFTPSSPDPTNNVGSLGTLTCQPFTGGGGGGGGPSLVGLKTKVRGNRAIISGEIKPPAPGKQVKITFFANGSPLRKIAKKSATLNAQSKFKKSFRVPTDSTRCKVKVAFQGQAVGQKKFKC
jgi:hypothetical protein